MCNRATALTSMLLILFLGNVALGAEAGSAVVIDASKYPNLQSALDAASSAGGLVKLPAGRFEITEPLVVGGDDVRIEGHGAATHLVNKNEAGKPAILLAPKTLATNKNARIWRVQLADLRISGNPKSGDGVRAEGVNEIYLHGVAADHNGGHGIHLIDCYEDPRVGDCILTYNANTGLTILRGHDIVVSGNQFEENNDALRCIDSFNLCMTGNNLDDHLRHGVVIENTYGSVLSGNMIEECKGIAVILDRDCYGIALSANVIAHNFSGGIDLRDAWGCSVSANTFVLDHVFSLRVGPQAGRIPVTGNSFCNSHIGDTQRRKVEEDIARGILLEATADVTIVGNTFSGLQGPAVQSKGACKRVVFANNVITDLATAAPGSSPLDLREAADTVIDGNIGAGKEGSHDR